MTASTARDTVASIANFSGGDAWYNITVRNDTHYVSDFDYYFSRGATGVEMEALTAVSVAALTIYDMCKAIDRSMTIDEIKLNKKTGGKSGEWIRKSE